MDGTHAATVLHSHRPFSGGAKPRSPLLAQRPAVAAPNRESAQLSSSAEAANGSDPTPQHHRNGSPAAASRRAVLLGAAAAAAASLAGEQQAQAVQGLTAGRLPGVESLD